MVKLEKDEELFHVYHEMYAKVKRKPDETDDEIIARIRKTMKERNREQSIVDSFLIQPIFVIGGAIERERYHKTIATELSDIDEDDVAVF